MTITNILTCPCCDSDLEYDQGTQPTCTNGVPYEGIEPCYYCEECGHEEDASND